MERIPHILLVIGPSGAGKSVFISQLKNGELPAEIRSAIPAGAESWSEISRRELKYLDMNRLTGARGVIVHLAIIRRLTPERPKYATLAEQAEAITVVHIMTDPERLTQQLAGRLESKRQRQIHPARVFLGAIVGRILTLGGDRVFRTRLGKAMKGFENSDTRIERKIRDAGRDPSNRGEDFLISLAEQGVRIDHIYIRPAADSIPSQRLTWDVLSPTEMPGH